MGFLICSALVGELDSAVKTGAKVWTAHFHTRLPALNVCSDVHGSASLFFNPLCILENESTRSSNILKLNFPRAHKRRSSPASCEMIISHAAVGVS